MINYLHTFNPRAELLSFGPISIYWYGFFVVIGMITALWISLKIAKYYNLKTELVFDLSFWLIVNGLIGARVYEVFLELPYYLSSPLNIFKVWEGGLAIHGGIIAGLITLFFFARKNQLYFWKLTALFAPGLAIGQAIGRFGNYFNQELFGRPTNLAWGIPIDIINRPLNYLSSPFFHPTFLYESIGLIFIFLILLILNIYHAKKESLTSRVFVLLSALYMILYSVLRFSLEFIKIDKTPMFLNLRWPQFISLIFILISLFFLISTSHDKKRNS